MLERLPDYFIGSNGRPAMVSRLVNPPSPAIPNKKYSEEMAIRNYKTVKCLNNEAIQSGRHVDRLIPDAPSSSKPGGSSINTTDSRRRHNVNVCEITSITSTKIRCTARRSPVISKTTSPGLLRNRGDIPHYINHHSTSTSSSAKHCTTANLLAPVLPKCSKSQAQLDNRLSNQRSYDRHIFGFTKKTEQFVLPPLPT